MEENSKIQLKTEISGQEKFSVRTPLQSTPSCMSIFTDTGKSKIFKASSVSEIEAVTRPMIFVYEEKDQRRVYNNPCAPLQQPTELSVLQSS